MYSQILVINGGSSSIKFALYMREGLTNVFSGTIERIGIPDSTLTLIRNGGQAEERHVETLSREAAIELLFATIKQAPETKNISAIGHRIVHGMNHSDHMPITQELREELRSREHMDPEHLPFENAIIDSATQHYPDIPHIACFDTVFHQTIPDVAKTLPIPRRFMALGVRKYGFHGLSCEYVLEELRATAPELVQGRIVIAHLGSGSSVTAVKGGVSIDTSMGFTPTGGIPMSSRTGDLDPGTLLHIARTHHLDVDALEKLISHESGLLGISETTADMHDLLLQQDSDPRAKEAIDVFCYETKKRIASYAGVLGGIDALIFVGGIGERSHYIREHICEGLEWMGITENDPSRVRVVHTDEELMMARIVLRKAQ